MTTSHSTDRDKPPERRCVIEVSVAAGIADDAVDEAVEAAMDDLMGRLCVLGVDPCISATLNAGAS